MVIACGVDEMFALGCAVMIRSLLNSLPQDRRIALHLMHGEIAADTSEKMLASWNDPRLTVTWIDVRSMLPEGLMVTEKSQATYYRLLLPMVLPNTCSRVLYLDTDMLILADITSLWETDLRGNIVAAAPDLAVRTFGHPRWGIKNFSELGFSADQPVFNGGVMLIDLDTWRSKNISGQVLDFSLARAADVRLWDQDGLNVALAFHWLRLDPRWNSTTEGIRASGWTVTLNPLRWFSIKSVERSAKILHFIGNKPWYPGCQHPRRELFYRFLDRTVWSGYRPDSK